MPPTDDLRDSELIDDITTMASQLGLTARPIEVSAVDPHRELRAILNGERPTARKTVRSPLLAVAAAASVIALMIGTGYSAMRPDTPSPIQPQAATEEPWPSDLTPEPEGANVAAGPYVGGELDYLVRKATAIVLVTHLRQIGPTTFKATIDSVLRGKGLQGDESIDVVQRAPGFESTILPVTSHLLFLLQARDGSYTLLARPYDQVAGGTYLSARPRIQSADPNKPTAPVAIQIPRVKELIACPDDC